MTQAADPQALPRKEAWVPPGVAVPALVRSQTLAPGLQGSRLPFHSAPLSPHPIAAQVHGSRLRLHQVSPADSGEYVCRIVSSSGPLEASVLVTIEASGSSAVPVPGEGPSSGVGRLEEGGREERQAGRGQEPGEVGFTSGAHMGFGVQPVWA